MSHRKRKKPLRRLAGAAALVLALTLMLAPSPARAAGLLIADGGFGGNLEIVHHDVAVTINNGVAVTRVEQLFRNTENRQVEALYTFPVPKGASVSNFSMWINGQEMVGEVVEKERAREIYDSYKRVRRDPGLLEQVDYKTFEMRIFPIGPRAEQRVEVVYYQELDFDNDWATYVYPLASTTRDNADSRTQERVSLTLDIASEVPIVHVESPSHGDEFAMARFGKHHSRASFESSGGNLDRDFVLAYRMSRPRTGLDLVASKEPGEDGYFLMTLTAGEELKKNDLGMDYVFVLDISGSMNDAGKLAVSRDSVDAFIDALGKADRFEVVTFNVAAKPLFRTLRPADDRAKEDAVNFLRSQRARGGTFLEPAIRNAYSYKDPDRSLNVVILSDGMTEQGERRTLLRLASERPAATRLFTIGVGNDVNRPLLEQLAQDAGGLAAFVSRGDDFTRQAQAFRRKLLRPAVGNLQIEIQDAGVFDVEPSQLPNLYHGAPVRLYGRYSRPGAVHVVVSGDLGGERFEQQLQMELPGDDTDNPQIERMWAFHRIEQLLEQADRNGSREPVIEEVVRLGETFSIVTEYTSFLVLENDAEYKRWKIERRNAQRMQRDRTSLQRVADQLQALREKAPTDVGPMRAATPKDNQLITETPAQQVRANPASPNRPRPAPSRGADMDFGGGGGGGAFDPVTTGLVLILGGAAYGGWRRRQNSGR